MSYGKRCSFIMHKVKSVTTANNVTTQNDSLFVECDGNNNELQKLLELLNTSNDVEFNSKILSALSGFLIFNNRSNIDKIIKCNVLYDKIYNILSKGSPRKATDALNFISALLYVDADEVTTTRKALALYARNMTRVSGCLGAMSEMFCSSMMYLDTWKALCQCLAVACGECEINQSYCTHLVPMCIPKCSQENIDVFLVLQALLFNHNRNIKLFLNNNGLSVFTRELLHYDKCLQVLTIVAQCQAVSPLVFKDTAVLTHLRDFIQQYGPRSQLGQKATIILNHIQSRTKGTIRKFPIVAETNINKKIKNGTSICPKLVNTTANTKVFKNVSKASKNTSFIDTQKAIDDTAKLMNNVMREVFQWKQDEAAKLKKAVSKRNNIGKLKTDKRMLARNISNNTFTNTNKSHRIDTHSNISHELSFSFINNIQNSEVRHNKDEEIYEEPSILYENDDNNTAGFDTVINKDNEAIDLDDFVPVFASTPKQSQESNRTAPTNMNLLEQNTKTTHDTRKIINNNKLQKIRREKEKRRVEKKRIQQGTNKDDKDIKNRTIGSRFFSAINDSCTKLVKSVKNMFTKKEHTEKEVKDSLALDSTVNKSKEYKPCSQFSFTNYMKRRDEILKSKMSKINNSNFSIDTSSCKTCDNTEELRKKVLKDENLKQTIKKLKLGINLYGCDFKKISQTMWPRESYMTPTVLYNLYRKLILK